MNDRDVQHLRANIEHGIKTGVSDRADYLWCCDQVRKPCGGAVTLLARLTQAERQLEDAIDYRNAVAQDHLEEKTRAEAAERKTGELHDELMAEFSDRMAAEARAEAAETALREVDEAIERENLQGKLDHVVRRRLEYILKRARTTTTEEVPHA